MGLLAPIARPASTRFPMEVIENIVQETDDPSTLAAMMCVSRRMYEVAAPRLYCEIIIHGKNLYRLHVGAFEENATKSGVERQFQHDDQDTATGE
jgi:hypothetical protein